MPTYSQHRLTLASAYGWVDVFFSVVVIFFWAGGMESEDASHESAILKQKL